MWPFENKDKREAQTVAFADILTGLQNAISQVQDMLQNAQLQNLSNFWKPDGQPISQTVQLGDKTVDVPLMTLVPHSQLAMDTVRISFSTRVGNVVSEKSEDLLKAGNLMGNATSQSSLSHADLQVAMDGAKAGGEDVMQVSITFKIKDTPEAVSRLMDEYNKRI